jgi:hypothetical protein
MHATHDRRALLLLALTALLAATGRHADAQDTTGVRRRAAGDLVRPVLEGAVSGAGLAMAYVAGGNSGWLVRDENAVRAALATGVAGALAVYAASTRLAPGAPDRPRLRIAVGASSQAEREVALGLRAPVYRRFALEGLVLVRNASADRTETQTRCSSILGCSTGTYVVDERREQSVAALVRGAASIPAGGALTAVLTAGVGPMASRLDATQEPSRRRDDVLATVGVGLEFGRVSRWTFEFEGRGPVPTWRGDATSPEFAVRVGRAFGYR